MRDDMDRIVIERPRHGVRSAPAHAGGRRLARNRLDRDGESAPLRIGMRHDRTKSFSDNLAPLYRWLDRQVDRPWNHVYRELCAGLDRRNVSQDHVFQHVDGHVALRTRWHHGEVWVQPRYGGQQPLRESWSALFVHPDTGILLRNRARRIERRRRRDAKADAERARRADRRMGLPGMPAGVQWHRVDGTWWEVTLGTLDRRDRVAKATDVLLKRDVGVFDWQLLQATYGAIDRYAKSRRQLGRRELRRHGLRGDGIADDDAV